MANSHDTCSVGNCDRAVKTYGMCAPHYHRNWLTGSPYRPCSECSKDIPVGTHGSIKRCEECRICKVDGCDRPYYGQGLCQSHHTRKRFTGKLIRPCRGCGADLPPEMDAGFKYCPECSYSSDSSRCGADGCGEPHFGRGLCRIHYGRMRSKGSSSRSCRGCGAEMFGNRGVRYCSDGCRPRCAVPDCQDLSIANGLCGRHYKDASENGGVLKSLDFTCHACGKMVKRSRGKKYQSSRKFQCDSCRRRTPHNVSGYRRRVLGGEILADCGICGDPIDLTLSWPHSGSLAIDHIVPSSLGGGDDDRNLRPSHSLCNIRRGNKLAPVAPGVLTLF